MKVRTRNVIIILAVTVRMLAPIAQAEDIPPLICEPGTDTPRCFFQVACLNYQKENHGFAVGQVHESVKLHRQETRHATTSEKLAMDRSTGELKPR